MSLLIPSPSPAPSSSPAAATPARLSPDTLAALLVRHFGADRRRLRPHTTLGAAGLDRYAVLELVVILRDDHGARIDADDLTPAHTVADVLRLARS